MLAGPLVGDEALAALAQRPSQLSRRYCFPLYSIAHISVSVVSRGFRITATAQGIRPSHSL